MGTPKEISLESHHLSKYGALDVLELAEVEKPTLKDDEVLIRILAATVTAGDCEVRRFHIKFLFWLPLSIFFGITKPKKYKRILGQELAGKIEVIGKNVTRFKTGGKVFAVTDAPRPATVNLPPPYFPNKLRRFRRIRLCFINDGSEAKKSLPEPFPA